MGSAKAFSNATLNTLSVFHPLQWWLRLPLNDLIGTDGGWSETQTSEVISHSLSLSNQHWYCFWKVKCVISLPLVAPSGIVMVFLIGQTGSDITTLNVFRIAHDYLCNIKYVYCVYMFCVHEIPYKCSIYNKTHWLWGLMQLQCT